ncbi:Pentatricopeptide repeat-containing protein, chloroplastic [Symbiodinium microadriaticum]|uniref:Pentatricopeptide repeat-containing protein, chloroplastic n=1 Tax=Symbiodinium microadriaticum TaxID=2951 RepID=A0A1Q9DZC7_SYMMI|nr:Pentatricopeptide repeat-containing protein, chloroplastic [Symbiodinium microadriaticum]
MACASRVERPHMKAIALLRESVDTSDWELAVSVLSVLRAGVQHDQRSFSIALKASGRALAWEAACGLLLWMDRVGICPDSITYSTAAMGVGQRWKLSVGLWADMKQRRILPDVVNYGSVINACQQAQEWSSALSLLGSLALAAISVNAIIAGSLISACVVWKEALAIFGAMQSRRVQPNSVIYNAMASSYEETGQWVSALTFLQNASQSWTLLDIISFNSVVSAGEKAYKAAISACEKSGGWDAALGLSQSVALRSISGDIVTIGAAMSGCQASGDWHWAVDLLKHSAALSLRLNRVVLNTAIAASQGQWQLSAGLMCEMAAGFLVPGTLTLGAAIGACAEWSKWSMVLRLFQELQECQLRRSDLIHNSAVTAASDGSRWSGALELLHELRAVRVQQDVLSFSSSVAACRDEWKAALSVVEEMAQAVVSKDVVSMSYAVTACERGKVPLADVLELIEVTAYSALSADLGGNGRHAAVVQEMYFGASASGVQTMERSARQTMRVVSKPTLGRLKVSGRWLATSRQLLARKKVDKECIVYNACISACEKAGQWQHALALFSEMEGMTIQKTSITYNATVSACEKGHEWELALTVVSQMEHYDVERCSITYNACMAACDEAGQWQHVLHLLEDMSRGQLRRDAITYHACVMSCEKSRQWQRALGWFEEMHQKRLEHNSNTFNAVVSSCEQSGQWPAANQKFGPEFFSWYHTGRCSEAERWRTPHNRPLKRCSVSAELSSLWPESASSSDAWALASLRFLRPPICRMELQAAECPLGGADPRMPPADVLLASLPGRSQEMTDFRVVGMNLSKIEAQANASQMALTMPGWAVTAVLESLSAPWVAVWSAELRDGSNYLKLSARLSYRGRSADEKSADGDPEAEAELCLLSGNLPGSSVAGKVDGVPITSDDFFFGLEHPQGLNSAKAGDYRCCLKQHTAKIKEHGPHAALVLGVTVPGQVRRSFLHYLERERAHPSRKMLHYNSWYDIGTGQQFDAKQAINRLDHIARELSRRGVMLDSFLLDDGWDDPDSGPWNAHENFRDLKQLEDHATYWKTSLGLWFSPFGGYHEARQRRVLAARRAGIAVREETRERKSAVLRPGGCTQASPCEEGEGRCGSNHVLMLRGGAKLLKLDGIGNPAGLDQTLEEDFDAAVSLIAELRKISSHVFINLSTGTWPSPFWLLYSDAWDLNQLEGSGPGMSNEPFKHEVRSAFGSGVMLQELYVTPSLLNRENWDDVAEAAKWASDRIQTLADVQWFGGDPSKGEVYGWAAWHGSTQKTSAILTLRNPSPQRQSVYVDPVRVFSLPDYVVGPLVLNTPFSDQRPRQIQLVRGRVALVDLPPFAVLVFDTSGPTPSAWAVYIDILVDNSAILFWTLLALLVAGFSLRGTSASPAAPAVPVEELRRRRLAALERRSPDQ